MSINYTPITDFLTKDTLPKEDPDKVILGADFSSEFDAISTAFLGAAPTLNPTFSGTVTFVDATGATLTTTGTATIGGAATVGGNLDVTGNVTATDLTLTGDLSLPGGAIATETYVVNEINAAVLAPITELDDVADVNTTAVTEGQFLQRVGSEWVGGTVNVNNITGDLTVSGNITAASYNETYTGTTGTASFEGYQWGQLSQTANTIATGDSGTQSRGLIQWSADGVNVYINHTLNNDSFKQYVCSTPYDFSTATLFRDVEPMADLGYDGDNTMHVLSSDGVYVFSVYQATNAPVQRATLTTPFDIGGGTSAVTTMRTLTSGGYNNSIHISDDGTRLFVCDDDYTMNQYNFVTPYDIDTLPLTPVATFLEQVVVSSYGPMCFTNGGTNLVVADNDGDFIYVYELSTAWELSTVNTTPIHTVAWGQNFGDVAAGASSIGVHPQGKYFYSRASTQGDFTEWSISIPSEAFTLDCSTANVFTVTATTATSISFSNVPAAGEAYACTIEVSTAGNAVTWPTGITWPSATPPTLSAGTDVFVLSTRDGGTTWNGFTAGQEMG